MKKRLLMMLVGLMVCFTAAMAQAISGTVVSASDGEPIIGATVKIKGTAQGTVTDIDGKFTINASGKTLVFSYVGMQTAEAAAKNGMKVALVSDANDLDEVVITAYGTSTKGTFTGSAGVMKAEKIELRQVSDVSNALAGAVAGVQIQSSNGQPGTSASVKIRGVGSINAGTTPLYVVDGVPYDGDLSSINTQDIESLTVLKDAASTALYGARGANGIIMITTKRGNKGDAVVSFDAKWGSNSRQIKNYNVLRNSQEYLENEYAAIYNAGTMSLGYDPVKAWQYANTNITKNVNGGNGYQIYTVPTGETLFGQNGKLNPNAKLGYTDTANNRYYTPDNWEDIMFRPTLRQEYNVNISGSNERNNFYMSGGYLDDGGLISGSGFQRLSVRLKDEYQVKSWMKVGANMAYSNSKSYYPDEQTNSASSGNAFYSANVIAPIYPLYVRDAEGNIIYNKGRATYDYGTLADGTRDRSFMSISNPAGQLIYDKREFIMDVLNGNAFVELTPLKGLTLTAKWGLFLDNTNENLLDNAYMGQFAAIDGAAYQYHTRTKGFDQQYIANYAFTLNEAHNFDITAGYDGYSYKYKYLYAGGSGLYDPESFYLGNVATQYVIGGYPDEYATAGYFARVNYSYDDKYIANVAFRRDGSSRFNTKNRWGNFWSGSVAWLISKEKFMENVEWVNLLKFKASVGQQGNDNIKNYYAYTDQFSLVGDASGWSDGTLAYKGNPDLTWETSTSFNAGFDFGLFNNRLNGSLEYYSRRSTDMLYYKPVAGSLGYSQIPMNIGSMTNSGLELDLTYSIISNKNVKWDVNFNASTVKNTIKELHKDLNGKWIDSSRIYEEGQSMYRMFLPEWAGVNPENGEPQWYITNAKGEREITNSYAQASKTENRIATDDLLPDVYGGFGTSVTAYGFDLSVQCSYQLGGEIYDNGYAAIMHSGYTSYAGRNWHKDIRNAWTTPGQITDVPRLNAADQYSNSISTRFLTNSNYLSINNVTVGYSFPRCITSRLGLSKLRIYFAGDNLALISARKGLDPRQGYTAASVSTYTAIRTLSGGISVSF